MAQKDLRSFFTRSTTSNADSQENVSNIHNVSESSRSLETPSTSKDTTSEFENVQTEEPFAEIDTNIHQPAKRQKKRKYDKDYLRYGFISVDSNGEMRPLCLVCKTLLANSSLNPAKLSRHLNTQHIALVNKPIEYFEKLKDDHFDSTKSMRGFTNTELKAIEASYIVAREIAKSKKPYRLAEQFFQPCVSEVVRSMFGDNFAMQLNSVPMSHQTIARRVSDMATDIRNQLCSRLQNSVHFSLQFDVSTDVTNKAILLGFVRYIHGRKIVEEMFCFHSLADRTTGEKIFEAIQMKFNDYGLDMKKLDFARMVQVP